MGTERWLSLLLGVVESGTAVGDRSPYPLILLVLFACWLALPVAMAAGWRPLRAQLFPAEDRGRTALAVAALFLVGLALRLVVSPRLPMLSTCTGLEHVETAYLIADGLWNGPFRAAYPLAVPALASLPMQLFGLSPDLFFVTVGVLSALLVPALYMVGRLLWESPAAGLVAALFGALFPPFLTFATTGSLAVPYATLATLSMGLLLAWRRSGSQALLTALLAALVLVLQTRLEAALFIVPVLAALALDDAPAAPGLFRARTWTVAGIFLLAALPYLVTKTAQLGNDPSMGNPPLLTGSVRFLLEAALLVGFTGAWSLSAQKRHPASLPWLAALLFLFWGLSLLWRFGHTVFYWGPTLLAGFDQPTEVYAPVGLPMLDPKLTPLLFVAGYFASICTLLRRRERRTWLLLNAWCGVLFAASLMKSTGELPFEGVRTALPALPPFLLLAARGVVWLRGSLRDARVPAADGVLVAAGVLSLVIPVMSSLDTDFDQQAEYRFVRSWVEELPDGATLLLPNETREVAMENGGPPVPLAMARLMRTRALFDATLGSRRDRVAIRLVDGAAAIAEVAGTPGPLYFYEGLDCHRTGSPSVAPLCQAFHALPLRAVHRAEVPVRLYNSDFVRQLYIASPTVPLTLYRVQGGP
jgi:4-amino-4-deoxy-L-arabinose transferase-like glycosyltransferase